MCLKECLFVLLALSAIVHGRSIDQDENAVEESVVVNVPARTFARRQAMTEEELQKLLASLGGAGSGSGPAPPGGGMGDLSGDFSKLSTDLTSLFSGFGFSSVNPVGGPPSIIVPPPPPPPSPLPPAVVPLSSPPPPPPAPAPVDVSSPAPAPAPVDVSSPAPAPAPAPEMVLTGSPTFGALEMGGSTTGMDASIIGGSPPVLGSAFPNVGSNSFPSGGSITDFSSGPSGSNFDQSGMNPVSFPSTPGGSSFNPSSLGGPTGNSMDTTRAGSLDPSMMGGSPTDPTLLGGTNGMGGPGGMPGAGGLGGPGGMAGSAPEEQKSKTRVNAVQGPRKASLETPAGAKKELASGRSLGGAGYGVTSDDRKSIGSLSEYIKQTPKAVLKDGEAIEPGKMLEVPGCDFKLVHQKDGNVVLSWGEGNVEWSSKTSGVGGPGDYTLRMDKGVLSLYAPGWRKGSRREPIWKTEGSDGATMAVLLRDGNFVLVTETGDVKWATNTIAKIPCKGEESVTPRAKA